HADCDTFRDGFCDACAGGDAFAYLDGDPHADCDTFRDGFCDACAGGNAFSYLDGDPHADCTCKPHTKRNTAGCSGG
ncbi:MAG: hypothetical protein ACUVSU_00345, partial [Aggregatilineaceae bacterium]